MTKIMVSPDCTNTPRKEFLKEFNIAFATGNAEFIIDHVDEEIKWIIHGDKQLVGKEVFAKEINIMKEYTANEVAIHAIITDGRQASLHGEMKMGEKTYVFCDIYHFMDESGNVIERIDSYVIQIT